MSVLITGKKTYHDEGSIPDDIDWSKGMRGRLHKRLADTVRVPLDGDLVRAYETVSEIEVALHHHLGTPANAEARAAFAAKAASRVASAGEDETGVLCLDKTIADRFDSVADVVSALREYAGLTGSRRRTA